MEINNDKLRCFINAMCDVDSLAKNNSIEIDGETANIFYPYNTDNISDTDGCIEIDGKIVRIFCPYDMDTPLSMPNCSPDYNPEREKKVSFILDLHGYKRIKSETGMSPRGEWYMYATIWDGQIIEIGEEQGNYAGGVVADANDYDGLVKEIEYCKKEYMNGKHSYAASLYEKIKDYPIAKEYPVAYKVL